MAKIKLDDVEYDTEDMSDNAKAQLASLQFNEAHINRLKNERIPWRAFIWGPQQDAAMEARNILKKPTAGLSESLNVFFAIPIISKKKAALDKLSWGLPALDELAAFFLSLTLPRPTKRTLNPLP